MPSRLSKSIRDPHSQPVPPPLPEVSREHVRKAQELLDKGLAAKADAELDLVDPRFRMHPDVLEVRIAFNVSLKKFEEAVTLARLLERFYPERKGVIPRQTRRFGLDKPMAP